jgi:hypothetical protein
MLQHGFRLGICLKEVVEWTRLRPIIMNLDLKVTQEDKRYHPPKMF